jgi:hypothetical protein
MSCRSVSIPLTQLQRLYQLDVIVQICGCNCIDLHHAVVIVQIRGSNNLVTDTLIIVHGNQAMQKGNHATQRNNEKNENHSALINADTSCRSG